MLFWMPVLELSESTASCVCSSLQMCLCRCVPVAHGCVRRRGFVYVRDCILLFWRSCFKLLRDIRQGYGCQIVTHKHALKIFEEPSVCMWGACESLWWLWKLTLSVEASDWEMKGVQLGNVAGVVFAWWFCWQYFEWCDDFNMLLIWKYYFLS